MNALSLLTWTTATLLLVGVAEAFFKKLKYVPLPPGECVLGFDYCKIGCSYCTRCYVNFIDCSLTPRASPDEILQKNRTDLCITALDKCKGSCIDCTPCYTMFIDCKQQMNKNESAPLTVPVAPVVVNKTTPEINIPINVSGQETSMKTAKENTNDGDIGKVSSVEENGIDIGMPGIPVFLVDKNKFPGLSRSDINEFYDAVVEISDLLRSYGVHDATERLTRSGLVLPPVQEDLEFHETGIRAHQYQGDAEIPSVSDESVTLHEDNLDSHASQVRLAPTPVVASEINEDAVKVPQEHDNSFPNNVAGRVLYLQEDLEFFPSGTENQGHVDDSLFHEAETVLLVPNDDDSLPGTAMPAADLPGTAMPAADLPGTAMPAADLPVTDMPAADLPGTDRPAADLPGTDRPVSDAEFHGVNVRFPQESEQHENLKNAFEDPYHIDPRLVR